MGRWVPLGKLSTKKDFLAVLAFSSYSPSNPSLSIIQQFYMLAIASTELCELVLFDLTYFPGNVNHTAKMAGMVLPWELRGV